MLRSHHLQNVSCEQQAKFVQERIVNVEKHFSEICSAFGAYTRRIAGLRDKSDELSKVIQSYADSENVNKSLKSGLTDFTSTLFSIGDYRDIEVKRLEGKVISELTHYDGICKHAREEVKSTFSAKEKEQGKIRHLDRVRARNPHNRQLIIAAEAEVLQATAEVSRTRKILEEQVDVFEKKKMRDIKSVLLDYILIELSYHAKAIELFTRAYNEIQSIDEDGDLAEFRDILRVPESISRLNVVKRTSFRGSASTHLGSLANLFSTSSRFGEGNETAEDSHSNLRTDLNVKAASVDSLKKGLGSVQVGQFDDDASSFLSYEEEEDYDDQSGDGREVEQDLRPTSTRKS